MRAISRGLLKAASRFAFAFRKDAPHTFKVSCFDCMVLGMMLHPIDNLPQCGPSGCWPRPRIPVGRPVPGGRFRARLPFLRAGPVRRLHAVHERRALEPVCRQAFQRPGREMTPCRLRWRGIYLSDGQRWFISCGHRQVVRHQLPKLTLAGSSPVARSKKSKSTTPFRRRAFFQ